MACAVKRPYNFDLLSSPQQLSPKRHRCAVAASVASTSAAVSPFVSATPTLTREELAKNVQDEWRRLQRRRKVHSPTSPPLTCNMQDRFTTQPTLFWSQQQNRNSPSLTPPATQCSSKEPTLKMKQVVLLCERLWKEREEKLREEYDQVLHERLTDQYDSFLKFTQDQIMRKYQQSSCSYVS